MTDSMRLIAAKGLTSTVCRQLRCRILRLLACMDSAEPLLSRDGGDEETRTPDPLLAKEVLSQLSYIPVTGSRAVRLRRIKRLTTGPEHTRRDGRIGS